MKPQPSLTNLVQRPAQMWAIPLFISSKFMILEILQDRSTDSLREGHSFLPLNQKYTELNENK